MLIASFLSLTTSTEHTNRPELWLLHFTPHLHYHFVFPYIYICMCVYIYISLFFSFGFLLMYKPFHKKKDSPSCSLSLRSQNLYKCPQKNTNINLTHSFFFFLLYLSIHSHYYHSTTPILLCAPYMGIYIPHHTCVPHSHASKPHTPHNSHAQFCIGTRGPLSFSLFFSFTPLCISSIYS